MHFGIEFDKGLHLTANGNLKRITLKGWANVDGGLFAKDNIKENGELSRVRASHVALVHRDIQHIMHYCGIDFIYSFDAVHIKKAKRAKQEARKIAAIHH
jgi:hypothetical protein